MKKRMLAILITLVIILSVVPSVNTEAAARTKKKAYKAYYSWIKKSADAKKYTDYKLLDMNNDKIPELIGTYQDADNQYLHYYIVCSYDGSEVKMLGLVDGVNSFGKTTVSYIPKAGKVCSTSTTSSTTSSFDYIHKIKKDGKLEILAKTSKTKSYDQTGYIYRWDDVEVTEAEYNKKYAKAYNASKAKSFGSLKYTSKKKMLKQLKKLK